MFAKIKMTIIFIITVFMQNPIQLEQVIRCLRSIRKYHREQIIILNDTEDYYYENIKHNFDEFENITVIHNKKRGLGELQVFQFILDCDKIEKDDNVIYLHDSCVVLKSFEKAQNIQDMRFIMHFTNHIKEWGTIIEEQTPYNVENKIITHVDAIDNYLKKYFWQNPHFFDWALDATKNREKWVGCFGYMCIVKKRELQELNKVIPFAKTFTNFKGRRDRIINESIFSLICNYFYGKTLCEQSFDGLYYDGVNCYTRGKNTYLEDTNYPLYWCIKGDYVGKISFNR